MRRWRSLLPLIVIVALLGTVVPSLLAEDADKRAELAEDRQAVTVLSEGSGVILEFTLTEWHDWAMENLAAALGGPVRIGEQQMPASTFDSFGAAAVSPAGDHLVLSAQTYAMLTTVSVVGILGLERQTFSVVGEPAFGGVTEFHWSPDGEFIAYALGTARAHGDRLRVDHATLLRPALELNGEELIEAARRQFDADLSADPRQWLPRIRELDWSEGRLFFTTDGFEEGELRWSVEPELGELKLESNRR